MSAARRVADLTVDELVELVERAAERGMERAGGRVRKRTAPARRRPLDEEVEISDTDRAAARAAARRLGLHVKGGR